MQESTEPLIMMKHLKFVQIETGILLSFGVCVCVFVQEQGVAKFTQQHNLSSSFPDSSHSSLKITAMHNSTAALSSDAHSLTLPKITAQPLLACSGRCIMSRRSEPVLSQHIGLIDPFFNASIKMKPIYPIFTKAALVQSTYNGAESKFIL